MWLKRHFEDSAESATTMLKGCAVTPAFLRRAGWDPFENRMIQGRIIRAYREVFTACFSTQFSPVDASNVCEHLASRPTLSVFW
ncbi:MAG TPA: hypothetical protein VJ984_11120, partial [Xanthomonadales bacterium]|nr:hypothetical protein [Xanthomonadales bacterium]